MSFHLMDTTSIDSMDIDLPAKNTEETRDTIDVAADIDVDIEKTEKSKKPKRTSNEKRAASLKILENFIFNEKKSFMKSLLRRCSKQKSKEYIWDTEKRIVAFGSTLKVDPNKKTGEEWLCEHLKPKKISRRMEKRNQHLMRPLAKQVHPTCVPTYTFKPSQIQSTKRQTKNQRRKTESMKKLEQFLNEERIAFKKSLSEKCEEELENSGTKSYLGKERIVAFGSTVFIDKNQEKENFKWLCEHIGPRKISKREKQNQRLMRPLTRTVHAKCVPNYTFKPLQRKTNRSSSRMSIRKWITQHSRPKLARDTAPLPDIIRRTSPRTVEERKEWELVQSRPKQEPQPKKVPMKLSRKTKEEWEARLNQLSRPKRIYKKTPPPSHVNPNAFNYVMNARMEQRAQPKLVHPEYKQDLDYNFHDKLKGALEYKISDR
uniref:Uncharacterized protein n=1 Tax=Cacopsylla melanoneura TaxID=428564 RepID=A0A8D8Z9I2_9HEMI